MYDAFAGIALLRNAQSRAINGENPDGSRGGGAKATEGTGASAARELGKGWKVNPALHFPGGSKITLAEIEGPGVIRHIWITCPPKTWRDVILRFWWDGDDTPSIEVPLGDFFANGWCERSIVNSQPISVMAGGALNSYWPMPFRKSARVEVENRGPDMHQFFFQFDYTLEEVPEDAAYLHAQFRRSNPVEGALHTILDGVTGRGHYVGTYCAWQTNNSGWWGEGEVKFYLDGDGEYPTIAGTGTEDYFGGAWAFEQVEGEGYLPYSSPYLGFHQVTGQDNFGKANNRFGMYRWHLPDPIHFTTDLRVDVQALGWRSGGRYLPLKDDVATTAFWYQAEPHGAFPALGERNDLEVI